MGVAASIVSAVLKSVVGDKLGGGLAKEIANISINGISEKGINEITDFINKEKSKIDRILSRENNNYVVAEIKDLFSKISITDEVLRQCKYNNMILKDFMWEEYIVLKNKPSYIECESEIKACLFAVVEVLNKAIRESEDFSNKMLIQISNSVDDTNVGLQKISEYLNNNFGKLNADNQAILEIIQMIFEQNQEESVKNKVPKVKSRTQEYADKWNKNMFLNDFDEWDENAGVNVKLSDVYIDEHLPHFLYEHNEKESDNLDVLLSKYIMKTNENKMLLILGQPGIGKSTLITWITVKFYEYLENILVYKFAEDLKDIDWQKSNISMEILDTLNLSYNDLEGKILILDGFDEVSIGVDRRGVLDNLYGELIYKKNTKKFSLIITCRENYIQEFERVKCKYIILQPWNETQIRSFCNIFQEKTKGEISGNTVEKLIENKEILGIPLILYMVLALNVFVEKEGSIVDIYDKIFSLDGGIYDRCIDNKKFAEGHRIGEIKEYVHQISRDIAIWMFENEADKANISQEEYQIICRNIMQDQKNIKEIEQDFLIGNFFKLVKHCEGIETEELYFVHRSIYEYFVAETIYNSIERCLIELSEESQEMLLKNIAVYLKQGEINYTIGEYLKYKILKLYKQLNEDKQELFYQWWEKAIEKMIKMGMFYYAKGVSNYTNIFLKETQCFNNIIEILRLISSTNRKHYILEDVDKVLLIRYIKHSLIECRILYVEDIEIDLNEYECGGYVLDLSQLSLEKAYLKMYNLSSIDLGKVNLKYSNLRQANLSRANLEGADLRGADLKRADLREAQLQFAQLESANLERANLSRANLIQADLKKANLTGVILSDAELEASRWYTDDVLKVLSQLETAIFSYIIIEDQEKKRWYRNDTFSGENGNRLSLISEQEKQLKEAGIDSFEFEMMDDDEKIEALEDAGLDPLDFDIY